MRAPHPPEKEIEKMENLIYTKGGTKNAQSK